MRSACKCGTLHASVRHTEAVSGESCQRPRCFTYQTPIYDVALGTDEFLVRLSGLKGTRHRFEMEDRHFDHIEPLTPEGEEEVIPPIVYPVAFPHLLFRNTTFAV